jgi:hypothetical protein
MLLGTERGLPRDPKTLEPWRPSQDRSRQLGEDRLAGLPGLELSGGLRGKGITLDWQYNRIRGDTAISDFTGGVYVAVVFR